MDYIIGYLFDTFIPTIVIMGVTFFFIFAQRKDKLRNFIRNQNVLFWFLITWTLFGFFAQQDFSERCGCLTHSRNLFSLDYIIFSAISLILFILSFLIKNKGIRVSLICIELAYWLFKLYFIKSGYIGGMGILVFKYYDFFGLLGRLLILNTLTGQKLKEFLLVLIAGLLIIIKMLGVPCNANFVYRDYINPYYNRTLLNQLNGEWHGTMILPIDTVVHNPIDSTDKSLMTFLGDFSHYHDTTIIKEINHVQLSFQDSILNINNSTHEYDGNYSLTYSEADSKFLIYTHSKYLINTETDYLFGPTTITVQITNMTDSTITMQIDNRITIKLKTAGNSGLI
jgi:hypothetical protein